MQNGTDKNHDWNYSESGFNSHQSIGTCKDAYLLTTFHQQSRIVSWEWPGLAGSSALGTPINCTYLPDLSAWNIPQTCLLTFTINFTHQYVTFKQSTVPCYKNNTDHSQINLFTQLKAQARERFAEKMTSTYKLTYFDIRGKAEPARLVFAQVGVPYEDIRIRQDKWAEMKPSKCVLY